MALIPADALPIPLTGEDLPDTFRRSATETSPMLAEAWTFLAPRVAQLVVSNLSTAPTLMLASPSAFHAYAAYLQSIEWPSDDLELHIIAVLVEAKDPKELLLDAIPDAPAELWSVLGRLRSRAFSLETYRELAGYLAGPMRQAVLSLPEIGPAELNLLANVARGDPLVAAAFGALGHFEKRTARALNRALKLLRAAGVLETDAEAARALRSLRTDGLWRFVRRRLPRASAPPLSVTPAAPLFPIRTGAELVLTARRYRNCLATRPEHLFEFVTGLRHFMEWRGQEPAVASVDFQEGGAFSLNAVFGVRNAAVSDATHKAIATSLASLGLRQQPLQACGALRWLHELSGEKSARELPDDMPVFLRRP